MVFSCFVHLYISGEMIQFDYFFPNGLVQPPPSISYSVKIGEQEIDKLDQNASRNPHPVGILAHLLRMVSWNPKTTHFEGDWTSQSSTDKVSNSYYLAIAAYFDKASYPLTRFSNVIWEDDDWFLGILQGILQATKHQGLLLVALLPVTAVRDFAVPLKGRRVVEHTR